MYIPVSQTLVAQSIFDYFPEAFVTNEFSRTYTSPEFAVFQVILVISSGKFCFVEEVDLKWISKFKASRSLLFGKQTVKTFFDQIS